MRRTDREALIDALVMTDLSGTAGTSLTPFERSADQLISAGWALADRNETGTCCDAATCMRLAGMDEDLVYERNQKRTYTANPCHFCHATAPWHVVDDSTGDSVWVCETHKLSAFS